jgi:putative aminopeptidase FrvX
MKILRELCSVPTAPFAEQYVIQYIERFVNARRGLRLSRDWAGNLLIELSSRSKLPRWVFGAHMDHPGFIADKMLDARTLQAHFRGGVKAEYFQGAKVRFFHAEGSEITGIVTECTLEGDSTVPTMAHIRVSRAVQTGTPGMWDQGVGRTKGKKFYSRVCDDLAGAAAALSMVDQLYKKPPKSPIAVLLTRAEEEGFVGAIASVTKPQLLRKTDRIIAIETSAMQVYAPQGAGAIIRTGDRTSIFNSALTYFLGQKADEVAKKHKKTFKYQRALMPGGTCEATVYDVYGYTAASICVALGNYHNMDAAKKKIGPEYIDLGDWNSMVKLFVHLAQTGHEFEPGHKALRSRIEKRFDRLKHLL